MPFEIADGIQTGSFGKTKKVALTTLGSEHGEATCRRRKAC